LSERPDPHEQLARLTKRALAGNLDKAGDKLAAQGKLFVRDRLALLLDKDSFVEDGLLANNRADDLPADGVVTGVGRVDGRPVCIMANDPTVKAGSWGARTVEKIVRLTEHALRHELPVFWLVDSAGARITDQVELFPGRRGAGRIFYNQVRLSGRVPQICCLFGPSAAGGAYIPSFCDVVFMVEGNASMYLGSPRMAEMVIGERTTLEEMGGAAMHCRVSGCGDLLCADEDEAIAAARTYLAYFPANWRGEPPAEEPRGPGYTGPVAPLVPTDESQPFDVYPLVAAVCDEASFFEVKPLFAPELVVGFGRIDGRPVGVLANNSAVKGGVLFTDSLGTVASLTAVTIFAPWRMIPWRSTSVPIMNPGTSARNSSGTLNASHSQTNRAALSAESTNSTPPFCIGLLATMPTGRPSSSASPVITSGANSGIRSKNDSASMSPSIRSCMSYARCSSAGTAAAVSNRAASRGSYRGGVWRQLCGK